MKTKIRLTRIQYWMVKIAVKKNNPKLLYGLFANIVSNQYYYLNKLTDYEAMMYIYNNSYYNKDSIIDRIYFKEVNNVSNGYLLRCYNKYLKLT